MQDAQDNYSVAGQLRIRNENKKKLFLIFLLLQDAQDNYSVAGQIALTKKQGVSGPVNFFTSKWNFEPHEKNKGSAFCLWNI